MVGWIPQFSRPPQWVLTPQAGDATRLDTFSKARKRYPLTRPVPLETPAHPAAPLVTEDLSLMLARQIAAATFLLAFAGISLAQEQPPLIMEQRPGMTIRHRQRTDAPTPAPTPEPSTVIVAIVNAHALTREQLEARVGKRFDEFVDDIDNDARRVAALVGAAPSKPISERARRELDEDQKAKIAAARNRAEGEAVQEWVDHTMLADEARRQGIVVSAEEFRERLAAVQAQGQVDQQLLQRVLNDLRMSQAEYERTVYDGILIERLVNRYIELNWKPDDLRKVYDENPALFMVPETYTLAHFTVLIEGNESPSQRRALESLARRVRSELSNNADPEKLFEQPEYNKLDMGIWGATGRYTLLRDGLPLAVEEAAKRLRVGQVSDVIEVRELVDGKPVTRGLHVVKILDRTPAQGTTFETALPAIRASLMEAGRLGLLERLRAARTHRVIVNLSGIRPDRIPSSEELLAAERASRPVPLQVAPTP